MIKSLKGTQDILPAEITQWNEIENVSRRILSLYGFNELRTPIIEESALFSRSVGEDTDIVKKQMYTFKDQGGRDITLRPEETASVVRAYLEHNLDKEHGFIKLFYIGPMFRSERPQAGRLRQFHQIGVEAIGSYSAYMDAEIIILLDELLKAYAISKYTLNINSLGCEKDRGSIKELLKKELKYHLNSLCDDCKRRYKTNILRILDCKVSACKKIIASIKLSDFLCKSCESDFTKLQKILDESSIKYQISPLLVRGLDYYTGIVFEVSCDELGAQNAVAAGGRYDNLISDFGGPKAGACGFAIGVERVIDIVSKREPQGKPAQEREVVFIVTLGDEAYKKGFKILRDLRNAGIKSDMDYQGKSLKAQMRYADKIMARFVIILGEDELKEGAATLKDMKDSSQRKVGIDNLIAELKR